MRHYANQAPASGGSSATFYGLIGIAVVGGGGAVYYLTSQGSTGAKYQPPAKGSPLLASDSKPPISTFLGGDQGWLDLKLESVEQINHNTKKFRFALPTKESVSGLHVAC